MLILGRMGYNSKEAGNFKIHNLEGPNDYVFILFLTEVTIMIDGQLTTASPNSCIIYRPKHPQLYYNEISGFINDWFHFDGAEVESLCKLLKLPLNTLFPIYNNSLIRTLIKNLEKESINKDAFWEQSISTLVHSALIYLAREYQNNMISSMNPYKAQSIELFKTARVQILTNSQHPWSIEEMAALVQLSRSRFTVLYREFFHCTPIEDLINERIKKAKHLLCSSNMSIGEMANYLGYESIHHFNRQFKQCVGCAPSKYYSSMTSHDAT